LPWSVSPHLARIGLSNSIQQDGKVVKYMEALLKNTSIEACHDSEAKILKYKECLPS
jgi:hypothetical protein